MQSKILKRIPLERLMDLKIDYAFKQLFGNEKNKDITVVFLNAILQRSGREWIKDISFSNTETNAEHQKDKQSRMDLLAVTNAEEWINVEIQFTDKYDMVKRSLYYWSEIYRPQMQKGMGYKELRPVIAINLLNFEMFGQTKQFHNTFHLYEDEERFKLTDMLEFHFIEMPKLIQAWREEKLNPWDDVLTRWLLLLGMVDQRKQKVYDDIFKELEEIAMKDKTLQAAFENWETLSGTPEEVAAYQARLKRILDDEAAVREAELRMQDARKKALREGLEEGRQEGRKEGRKEGRQEEKESTARRLLIRGLSVSEVVEITELEEELVLEIQQKLS